MSVQGGSWTDRSGAVTGARAALGAAAADSGENVPDTRLTGGTPLGEDLATAVALADLELVDRGTRVGHGQAQVGGGTERQLGLERVRCDVGAWCVEPQGEVQGRWSHRRSPSPHRFG